MRKSLSFVVLALLLAACAGRPENLLLISDQRAAGATEIEMLVATTRLPSGDPGTLFSGERNQVLGDIKIVDIAISIPPDAARKVGQVQFPNKAPGDPAREFVTTRANVLEIPDAQNALRSMLRNKGTGHVLVFIHGYNNRFEDAVFSYAQFVHDSGAPVIPTLFTWPSRGQLLGYGYDRESANYSRDALEEILRRLDRNPAVTQITVMAHSMGNWLTLETLRQMEIRSGRLPGKIDTVIMAAPDVDVDVFRTQMRSLKNAGPQYILLASQDDLALSVSRRVWGSSVRLGAVDAAAEPHRSELEDMGLMVVDLTEAEGGGLNHAKYASVPEIAKVLGERIAAGHTLGVPKATLGDRIGLATASGAAAVGGAVGLVVTAPLAVVDANERDRFGHRVSAVGEDAKAGLGITAPTCPTERFGPRPVGCPEL